MPDLERRDLIVIAGCTPEGDNWIGCMGTTWVLFAPFLGIPATGRLAHMRYHEFFRIDEDKISEMHFIWDIPELMMQANAWPMAPQLGAYLCTPGPMSCDGLNASGMEQKHCLISKIWKQLFVDIQKTQIQALCSWKNIGIQSLIGMAQQG